MAEERVTFPSGGLTLEGLLKRPAHGTPAAGAVVCHPHPQYGGSMYNSVVEAIVAALRQLGYATLRFNFRGVGASEGEYGGGPGEAEDAAAAMRFLSAAEGVRRSGALMTGYSFGAVAAMAAAAAMEEAATVVAVAPPVAMMKLDAPKLSKKRVVLVAGDRDPYCPAAQLKELQARLGDAARLVIVPGADHFFGGFEERLTEVLVSSLRIR